MGYNQYTDKLFINRSILGNIPSDKLDEVYLLYPLYLTVVLLVFWLHHYNLHNNHNVGVYPLGHYKWYFCFWSGMFPWIMRAGGKSAS